MLALFEKSLIFSSLRFLATRKDGPFHRVPHLPVKGPRDYDYWRRLQRKSNMRPRAPRTDKLEKRRPAVYKPKKKVEKKVVTEDKHL